MNPGLPVTTVSGIAAPPRVMLRLIVRQTTSIACDDDKLRPSAIAGDLPRPWRAATPRGPGLDGRALDVGRLDAAPEADPHRQRPLADRADGAERDPAGPARLRLLRLPAALLRDDLRRSRRAGAGRRDQGADAGQRASARA